MPVRGDLAAGDLRALYLGWLLSLQSGELDEDETEPDVPAGLASLSGGLASLAEFLRLDEDLIAAAAAASGPMAAPDPAALSRWIGSLPAHEKDALRLRAATGDGAHLGAELQRRFGATGGPAPDGERRTVGQLLARAEARSAERSRFEAEARARQEEAARQEAAMALERRLAELARREPAAWREVGAHMASKRADGRVAAIHLLQDLRVMCARQGRTDDFAARVAELRQAHDRRHSLMAQMKRAGPGGLKPWRTASEGARPVVRLVAGGARVARGP